MSNHIAIDGNEANVENRVGSNVYAFEIIAALEKLTAENSQVEVTVLLRNKPTADMPPTRKGWQYQSFGPKKLWTQWALPLHLYIHRRQYQVFFSPGHYAPRHCPIPYVSSVMDTAYLDYPKYFKKNDLRQLTNWTETAVKGAAKVVAISQATKASVIKHYGRDEEDVIVAYPAHSGQKVALGNSQSQEFFKEHKIKKPYLLFVGTLQPRKNIINMVEAFEIFSRMIASRTLKAKKSRRKSSKLAPAQLVLAGKVGWLAEDILERLGQSPMSGRIVRTGFVSQKEKGSLYRGAFASILVGLHEGFGIPPLESLSWGVPPVVSNTSSLPEVVGKAGFQANPKNPQEIAEAIWDAYTMNATQKTTFRRRAKKQLNKFSWEDSAQTILDLLQEVGENQPQ